MSLSFLKHRFFIVLTCLLLGFSLGLEKSALGQLGQGGVVGGGGGGFQGGGLQGGGFQGSGFQGSGLGAGGFGLGAGGFGPSSTSSGINSTVASSCPFKEGLESVASLQQSATSLLGQLKKCDPDISSKIPQALNSSIPTITTNLQMVDCSNYQAALGASYQSAMLDLSNSSNSLISACLLSPTTPTDGSSSGSSPPNYTTATPACVKEKYQVSLLNQRNTCSVTQDLQKQANEKAAVRNYIMELTAIAQRAIDDPKCKASDGVVKSTLSTIISMAAISPSVGIAGAGLVAIGETLTNMLTQSDASKALKRIEEANFNADVNCLFYFNAKKANKCVEKLTQPLPGLTCSTSVSDKKLKATLTDMASIVDLLSTPSPEQNQVNGLLDNQDEFLKNQIKSFCPEGIEKCSAASLQSPASFTNTSKPNKRELLTAIRRFHQLLANKDRDSDSKADRSELGPPIGASDVKQMHIFMKAALEKNFAQERNAYEELLGLEQSYSEFTNPQNNNSFGGGSFGFASANSNSSNKNSRSTELGAVVNQDDQANILYSNIHQVFSETVVKNLNSYVAQLANEEQYFKGTGNEFLKDENAHNKFVNLGKILQLCTLNSGAFLQGAEGNIAASVSYKDSADFQKQCAPLLKCLGEPLPTNKNNIAENQRQICTLGKDYNVLLRRLQNLKISDLKATNHQIECAKRD